MYFRENKSLNGKPKPLRSNAYENGKATIIVVANSVKEERSSEVQTTSGRLVIAYKKPQPLRIAVFKWCTEYLV